MAITIQNLRITPYVQKNELKCVWGDTLTLTFTIPHVAGESYVCGIDNERVVYPPSRPVCAYTNVFTRDGDNVTFSLPLNTSKFRSYVSTIRKPMPVWLQVCRVGIDGKCETLVLDDILAIPSVLDATNTVCEGDPLKQLLENKMDKPAAAGTEGQVLTMDADGHYAWADLPHIPEDPVQSDWDESDSSNLAYIKNKPAISKVGHTGEYNDLLDKPDLKPVATSGSYNDLTDKPAIPAAQVQADYGQSDSGAVDYIKHKPDLSRYSLVTETGNSISMSIDDDYDLVVSLLDKNGNTLSTQDIDLPIESMIVDATYANGVLTLTLQNGNTVDVDISDIVSGLVPDSRKVNGHALDADVTVTASDLNLATVATTGNYNDLTDKPVIPEQVQSDWDQSDSQAVDYIKNKPVIPEPTEQVQADWDQSDSSSPAYIQNKPVISDNADYLYIEAVEPNITVQFNKNGTIASLPGVSLEYSLDKSTWNTYTWEEGTGYAITLESVGDRVWWRASSTNTGFGYDDNTYHGFSCSGLFNVGGCIMSLLDRNVQNTTTISSNYCFHSLFRQSRIVECGDIIPFNMTVKNTTNAFSKMFYHCIYLTKGPAVVFNAYNIYNDTANSQSLFTSFFSGCTALITAPRLHLKQLYVGKLSFASYFDGCSLLQNIDNVILEYTQYNLGKWAFQNMFQGCTSLVKAPAIPFIFLGEQCFSSMFSGCGKLEIGPDLKFSTYKYQCCADMFQNCSRLKYLGVAFTSWDTTATANWISSASVGVLNCPSSLDTSTRDTSHIPAAWAAGNGLTYPSKVAATSSYNDLVDRPVIPDAQVQSDWDQSDSTAIDYIKGKGSVATEIGTAIADALTFHNN